MLSFSKHHIFVIVAKKKFTPSWVNVVRSISNDFNGIFYLELLTTYTSPDDQETQNKILAQVSDYCGRKVTNHTLDEYVEPYNWNFIHAIYFSFTTCTTVGNSIFMSHVFRDILKKNPQFCEKLEGFFFETKIGSF